MTLKASSKTISIEIPKNLFLIESPLQLLNSTEAAIKRKDAENHIVIYLSGKIKSDDQILKILNYYPWTEIHFIDTIKKRNSKIAHLVSIIKIYTLSLNLKFKFRNANSCIFAGDFRARWMHLVTNIINPNKKYLMDDGAISIHIQNNYLAKDINHPFPAPNSIYDILLLIIYLPSIISNKKLKWNFFTSFDITPIAGQIIEKNSYEFISTKSKSYKNQKDIVYYFGSKYSESNIVSINEELNFLSKIYEHYSNRNLTSIYIPHRDDSENKINAIKIIGFEIMKIDVPAEIFILTSTEQPKIISGAYTTVLNNAKKIFPDMEIESFRLPIKKIFNEQLIDEIEGSYFNLQNLGVKIIDLK